MGDAAQATADEPINMNADNPPYDESQPICQIQVRFHNGQTKKITMNTNSPVSLLHEFVMFAAPVNGSYQLIAGFPPKPVENPSQTVKEAGLNGGVVTQKLV
jgi:UBX domain-containing protein 1